MLASEGRFLNPAAHPFRERLAALTIPADEIAFRDTESLRDWLYAASGIEAARIGKSRNMEELFGYRFGRGPRNISVIAGCHADEPAGPMTAQLLSHTIRRNFPELLDRFRFHVVPQMNPDGAENNRAWFRDPFDLSSFLNHVQREPPGDDIEFGWAATPGVRPEVVAAMKFLKPYAPYEAHFTLHGIAFAEGAWCLISPEWVSRADSYMDAFTELCTRRQFPQHDVDRKGEKGFVRIRHGFSTHPNSIAMRRFFLDKNDERTAQRFRPSSMEWIRSLGGDPFCVVSELPLFKILDPHHSFNFDITNLRAAGSVDKDSSRALNEKYRVTPVSLAEQIPLQIGMIVLALTTALPQEAPGLSATNAPSPRME